MPIDVKRTNKVSVFFTDEEYLSIFKEGEAEGRMPAEFVRRRVLLSMWGTVGVRLSADQRKQLLVAAEDEVGSGFGVLP